MDVLQVKVCPVCYALVPMKYSSVTSYSCSDCDYNGIPLDISLSDYVGFVAALHNAASEQVIAGTNWYPVTITVSEFTNFVVKLLRQTVANRESFDGVLPQFVVDNIPLRRELVQRSFTP